MKEVIVKRKPSWSSQPKLFICDVDRTLLTYDHVLLPQVAQAVSGLSNISLPLVLASARSPTGLERVHSFVRGADTVCCFNGAWIGTLSTRQCIKEIRIDRSLSIEAMKTVAELSGSPIWFDLEKCYALRGDEAVARQRTDVTGDYLQKIDDPSQAPNAPFKLLATVSIDRVNTVKAKLSEKFDGQLDVVQSGPRLIEIVAKGVRKDIAALEICERLGVSIDDVVAAGDSDNDYEMLLKAGYSITVENASSRIQSVSDLIAPSCDDGGLSLAIEWLTNQIAGLNQKNDRKR